MQLKDLRTPLITLPFKYIIDKFLIVLWISKITSCFVGVVHVPVVLPFIHVPNSFESELHLSKSPVHAMNAFADI
jgi:hypothetical protein